MAYQFDGTGAYFNKTSPVLALPVTMACWFNPDDVATNYAIMALTENAASFDRLSLLCRGDVAGDPVQADARNRAGTNALAATSTSILATTWQHAAGVFTSTTSRAAYLNGGGKGTNTTSVTSSSNVNSLDVSTGELPNT